MPEGWCTDIIHRISLTANLAEAAFLEKLLMHCLNVAAATEVIWVLLAMRVYGSWLFDISIKIYFQTFCWSGEY